MKKLYDMDYVNKQENASSWHQNPKASKSDRVFSLTQKGFKYLQGCPNIQIPEGLKPPEKEIRQGHFDHRMRNYSFWFRMKRGVEESEDFKVSSYYTDNHKMSDNGQMRSKIAFSGGGVEVEPDGAFYLERNGKRHLCLVEIDLNNNKLANKFEKYVQASGSYRKTFQSLFGTEFPLYALLVITTDETVIEKAIRDAPEKLKKRLLFTTFDEVESFYKLVADDGLKKENILFDLKWKVDGGERSLAKKH